jgi:hypothetical protein
MAPPQVARHHSRAISVKLLCSVFRLPDLDVGCEGFAKAPFSVLAKYQGSEIRYDDSDRFDILGGKVTDHRVLLGLKLHMGDRTPQQTDRAGATLDIVSPLANPTSPLMFSPFAGAGVV